MLRGGLEGPEPGEGHKLENAVRFTALLLLLLLLLDPRWMRVAIGEVLMGPELLFDRMNFGTQPVPERLLSVPRGVEVESEAPLGNIADRIWRGG